MDLLAKMTTFVRVVESGTLAAAAKQLRISSPAVSRQIATLERELGTELITRTTRRLTVTESGREYYERCLRILREVDDAQRFAGQSMSGLIRVSAPVTFGLEYVAPRIPRLMKKHPALLIELTVEDRLVALRPEGYDLAVRVGEPPLSNDLTAQRVHTFHRVLVSSPSYTRKHGVPSCPEAINRHAGLVHAVEGRDTWHLQRDTDVVSVQPRVAFRSNAGHVTRELATQGVGIAFLPEWFVGRELSDGRLRRLLPAWQSRPIDANAIWHKDARGVERIRAVVEGLKGPRT